MDLAIWRRDRSQDRGRDVIAGFSRMLTVVERERGNNEDDRYEIDPCSTLYIHGGEFEPECMFSNTYQSIQSSTECAILARTSQRMRHRARDGVS